MAGLGVLVGGALVNALAFSRLNLLFSALGGNTAAKQKRHDLAIEQLQAAKAEWTQRRTERLDFINEEHRRKNQAVQTFADADQVMHKYARVTGNQLDPLGLEPTLSDYYTPSNEQKDCEIAFIVLGMAATGYAAYKLL